MQNIEIKYKIFAPDNFRERIRSLPEVQFRYRQRQNDIYFKTPGGRLKIRLQENSPPCLIEYHRPDETQPRISDYTLTPLEDYQKTSRYLEAELGILAEVEKWRELYLYRNVRIHLDEVKELGWFVEFESVISENYDEKDAAKNLETVLFFLDNDLGEAQSTGYLDLLLNNAKDK
jgi:predicted adenylyl cyclase CyaB